MDLQFYMAKGSFNKDSSGYASASLVNMREQKTYKLGVVSRIIVQEALSVGC